MLQRFASNASANLIAGISATVFQIGLTAVASRSFEPGTFTIWSLALTLAALVPLFAANLATVVTRELVELPQEQGRLIMQAAKHLSYSLTGIAFVAIVGFSVVLHEVSLPLAAVSGRWFTTLVLVLTLAQLWQILGQPQFGWSYAHEQNWQVAKTVAGARLGALFGAGLLGLVFFKGAPIAIAACLVFGTVLGLAAAGHWRRSTGSIAVPHDLALSAQQERMLKLLKGFAIWAAGAAAIQYGLPAYISVIDPQHYNAFYLAFTLNLVVIGTVSAAASALLAPLARKRIAGDVVGLERWLTWAPVATGMLLVAVLTLLWLGLDQLLALWSPGLADATQVRRYVHWLALQTVARSMALIFAVVLTSAGTPAQLSRPILFELAITILVAGPIGWWFGDIAFLASLALAGLMTALFVAWTTLSLGVCRQGSKWRLLFFFGTAQITAISSWQWICR